MLFDHGERVERCWYNTFWLFHCLLLNNSHVFFFFFTMERESRGVDTFFFFRLFRSHSGKSKGTITGLGTFPPGSFATRPFAPNCSPPLNDPGGGGTVRVFYIRERGEREWGERGRVREGREKGRERGKEREGWEWERERGIGREEGRLDLWLIEPAPPSPQKKRPTGLWLLL